MDHAKRTEHRKQGLTPISGVVVGVRPAVTAGRAIVWIGGVISRIAITFFVIPKWLVGIQRIVDAR